MSDQEFKRFPNLPAELRAMIWKEAMPPYGVYTVLMLGREEPKPQQPPAPAPMAFRVVYRLEPVPHDQQDDELRVRLHTMRAIQGVNSEAAYELEKAFPTTIDCTGGKLRFNAVHDILSLSDLQCLLGCGFLARFARYSQGAVVFANNWHTIPSTMLFNNRTLWTRFRYLSVLRHVSGLMLQFTRQLRGFLHFLADCTHLKAVGVVYDEPGALISHLVDASTMSGGVMPFSLITPVMRDPFYQRSWDVPLHLMVYRQVLYFLDGLIGTRAVIKGLKPGPAPWVVPSYLQSVQITFAHPTVQDLEFLVIVPVRPGVRATAMDIIEERRRQTAHILSNRP